MERKNLVLYDFLTNSNIFRVFLLTIIDKKVRRNIASRKVKAM